MYFSCHGASSGASALRTGAARIPLSANASMACCRLAEDGTSKMPAEGLGQALNGKEANT